MLYAVPAALGVCFVVALAGLAPAWHLLIWLGAGLVALPYVHMSAKYLLPGVPAAALLIVLHAARARQQRYPLTVALLVALGWISGALIVWGDTTLASSQREAVDRLIVPRLRHGSKVWAGGQWAFLAYAEDAGASALANTPPLPSPGDTIVVSRLDYYGMLTVFPSAANCSTRRPTTDAARSCSTAILAPVSIPSVSATFPSLWGAGRSMHTTSTAYCLDMLIN